VARLKHIIKRLQAGQPADLNDGIHEEEEGPPEEPDAKALDGY